jgi:hypothetical protein
MKYCYKIEHMINKLQAAKKILFYEWNEINTILT